MLYTVYVIKSLKRTYRYIGITNNLARRLSEHNSGRNKTTSPYKPFKIVFSEVYPDRISARKREKYLKSGIGREYIKSLMLD